MSTVICHQLSFSWPDGSPVLDHLDATLSRGCTGLIGLNGSGKSTLLRLMAGELTPTGGSLQVEGDVGYLPQDLNLRGTDTVSDLLGITDIRRALAAIDSGNVTEQSLAAVEDYWDIEDRGRAALDRIRIRPWQDEIDVLDRTVATLSGGEAVLTALVGLNLRGTAVTLLDEPTNNLDRDARLLLHDMISTWAGALIVISHDRELLEQVDQIAELRDGALRIFGGPFSQYLEAIDLEQEAAERTARVAEANVRREKRQLAEARTKLDRRKRYAAKDYANKRRPKVIMQARKREAQVSAGKHRIMQTEKLEESRANLDAARDAIRDDEIISIDLPETTVPERRLLLELTCAGAEDSAARSLAIRGRQRVALIGPNGSGKTSLLRLIHDGTRSDVLPDLTTRLGAPPWAI